jgi:hypothetical protein
MTGSTEAPDGDHLPPYVILGKWVDPNPAPLVGWQRPRLHPYGSLSAAYLIAVEGETLVFPSKAAADAWKAGQAVAHRREGDWLQTFTGRKFWPLDPLPSEVCIEDIAHALAMKCRYGGHCAAFYSVAEHSVSVSRLVPPPLALWGLLHDAGEAYLADVPRPVKPYLVGWHSLEARVLAAVCNRFGLPLVEPAEVKRIDFAITADEKSALMVDGPTWAGLPPPVGAAIRCLPPAEAKAEFLARFAELYGPEGGA